MGLANLVPGISGGTMLLVAGVYPQFINGIAEVTTLKVRLRTVMLLATIVGAAFVAIVLLAAPVSHLVVHETWAMYSLFIGLTLGGVPVLWPMLRPLTPTAIVAILAGITIMIVMAIIGPPEAGAAAADSRPYVMYFIAGIAGASAMILPGVSGAYLLLILGQYVAILTAVSLLKDGLRGRDMSIIMESMHVVIPVGLGVVIGVVAISNLVRFLLRRFHKATIGCLLGLLLGAVVGLWPFQAGVAPEVGSTFRGEMVVETDGVLAGGTTGRTIEAADYPRQTFTPSIWQVAGSLGLIGIGILASVGISRLGASKPESTS